MTKTILLVAVAAIAFVLLRRFQQPKANTERLAMTVWAGFGPHRSAEDAEDVLRRACLAVFGPDRIREHESWMNGHIENFREAETRGAFQRVQRMMRAGLLLTAYGRPYQEACDALRAEAAADARRAADSLATQFPQFADAVRRSLPPEPNKKPEK